MYALDYQSRIPIYEQLKNQITRYVLFDILKPNEKLPAVRGLAQQLAINPNTVQKAYQMLESEGIIYTIPGKGCFVSMDTDSINFRREKAEGDVKTAVQFALNAGLLKHRVMAIVDEIYGTAGREQT